MEKKIARRIVPAVAVAAALNGCGEPRTASEAERAIQDTASGRVEVQQGVARWAQECERDMVSYGNGLYYFHCWGSAYPLALSSFLKKHPELEISTMTSDGTVYPSINRGFFVTFKKKECR
jgi:hypothetical protein